MRRILALVTIAAISPMLLSSCTMWAPPKHATWKNTTSVEEMERLYWQAIKDKDWVNVEAHTASNYRHASAGGYYDRQQILDTYKKIALIDYSLGDFEVADHAGTTIVTYNAVVTFELDGVRKGPMKYRNMSVWQQQKDGWQMIAGTAFPAQ
jgi:hypothetical protein